MEDTDTDRGKCGIEGSLGKVNYYEKQDKIGLKITEDKRTVKVVTGKENMDTITIKDVYCPKKNMYGYVLRKIQGVHVKYISYE